ncbi:hypothetical protein O9K51_00888 [Purpureocillium lavendulum]|uniref:Actin-like ATPase domain-containing protein n=1 Tax=Purpureocillium lavendulum TaxID=1247861 RepID=A0AB34G3U8_9HYPO|nr:hypothetical protein O9K51_00888 [Purpureocillium lavendulum]
MVAILEILGARSASKDSIIVGIDFGTTYSGVAWTDSAECRTIRVISNWDAELRNCSNTEKVPTVLSYDEQGRIDGWGHIAVLQPRTMRWFKLLLLDDKDVPKYVRMSDQFREAREQQLDLGVSPVDIAASFLKRLWEHSLDLISRELGQKLVNRSRLHIYLTVPAIWPLYAQDRMRQAARKAGLLTERGCGETTLNLVLEPEAAALATLSRMSKKSTVGDTIIVCDAGGGTADLISYVIESAVPFEVKECVKGEGDLCGGIFVDHEFLELVKRQVGNVVFEKFDKRAKIKFLNDNWEHHIKPQFDGKRETWMAEDLPAVCQAPGRGQKRINKLKFSRKRFEITSVFDPIVSKIEALLSQQLTAIEDQYHKPAMHVILVGGFGRSPYLYKQLNQLLSKTTTIHQMMGHEPTRHLVQDKEWCKYELKWRATNQMDWFIVEGQDLDENTAVKRLYQVFFDYAARGTEAETQAEAFYWTTKTPRPSRHEACVQSLCTVTWQEPVVIGDLPTRTNRRGLSYHVLEFDIEMKCTGGVADFAVIYKGERVASHKVHVEYH